MEHPKEYYQSFVMFLQHACDNQQRSYTYDKGCKIAGDYWMAICTYLKERHLARVNYGDLYIYQFPPLASIIADCKDMIAAIEKADHDRDLSNREKIENITYGRKAYELAEKTAKWNKRHLIVTGIVALGQIVQWIILIIQWLSRP